MLLTGDIRLKKDSVCNDTLKAAMSAGQLHNHHRKGGKQVNKVENKAPGGKTKVFGGKTKPLGGKTNAFGGKRKAIQPEECKFW